jgi:FkbM family methyltransferase
MGKSYAVPEALLPPDKARVIVDCGANVGITSLFLASRYRNALVYSVEPDEANFELLKRNTDAEPRIIPIHGAIVGQPQKTVRLTMNQASYGNFVTNADQGIAVPAFTIDQICAKYNQTHIDLLKVDIEGAEKQIFTQAAFLPRVGLVIIELHHDYGTRNFSDDVARWGFVVRIPDQSNDLKMIVAQPSAASANNGR